MARKKDKKKVSAKALRYEKFRKDKPSVVDVSMPELSEEANKQKMLDQERIDKFLRYNRNRPAKEVSERRMKSKR